MPSLTYNPTLTGLGATAISKQIVRTGDSGTSIDPTVPKGYAGTLSTRTDNETGTLTLGSGHGITTGQTIDLYWSGGLRRTVLVGTVATNSVPIGADNGGTGDNLPSQGTAIVASPRLAFNASIDGDNVKLIGVQLVTTDPAQTTAGVAVLLDSADDTIATLDLVANIPQVWDIEGGHTNPFTGDPITDGIVSQANTTYDATLRMMWVQDGTP